MKRPRLSSEQAVAFGTALCLLAAMAWRWFDLRDWHDSQRILQCLLLLAAGAAWLFDSGLRDRLLVQAGRFGRRTALAWMAALGLGVVSAMWSGFPRFGLLEVALFALSTLLVTSVMAARQSPRAFDAIALAMVVAAGTVLVVQFMSAYAAALFGGAGFVVDNLYRGGFSNPRFLGQFHTMALPLLLAACVYPAFPARWRAMAFAVLVMSLVLALLTASRATWYAWLAATLAVLVVFRPPCRAMLSALAAALCCSAAVFYAMFYVLPPLLIEGWQFAVMEASFGRLGQPFGLSMREVLWSRALGWIGQFPTLGIGPMGLALDVNPVAAHPHNAPLQIAAEWGLPASLLMAIAVLGAASGLSMGLRRQVTDTPADGGAERLVGVALAIALTGAAINALVDGVIVMPCTQLMLAGVAGWTAACLLPPAAAVPARARWPGRCTAVAIVAAMIALFHGAAPEARSLYLQLDRLQAAADDRPTFTRFWIQGWLTDAVDIERVRFLRQVPR
ncbi:MAG: O-antigen ligase family protein [bacterium]